MVDGWFGDGDWSDSGDPLNNNIWDDPEPEEDRQDIVEVWATRIDRDGISIFLEMWNWLNPALPIDLGYLIQDVDLGDADREDGSEACPVGTDQPDLTEALADAIERFEAAEQMYRVALELEAPEIGGPRGLEEYYFGMLVGAVLEYRLASRALADAREAIENCAPAGDGE